MKYTLSPLPYTYDALEPWIDGKTMEIHYTKHHQTYVDKLNAVMEKYPGLAGEKLEDLMRKLTALEMEDSDRTALRNMGGGHLNHAFFWTIMGPKKVPKNDLKQELADMFGSLDEFRAKFSESAAGLFGSGWAWLVRNAEGKLELYTTPNQDSPYLQNHTPVIGLDVWEHAYYLKYQNRRPEYIKAWWNAFKLF